MYQEILRALEQKNVAFLTGPGGTGKTYNINKACEQIKNIARTATTGIAATHISGETIHRFSGVGAYTDSNSIYKIVRSDFFPEIRERIALANLIVIDEISMLHRKQFELIDQVFRSACFNPGQPFGGKKILLSGDFLQLPPVVKGDDKESPWVFNSPIWKSIDPTVFELTKIYRQEDKEFGETLMKIRKGICTHHEHDMIRSREGAKFKGVRPVKLVGTNREAEKINQQALSEIKGKNWRYGADIEIDGSRYMSEKQLEFHRNNLIRDMIAPEVLNLKVGAQVMALKNGEGYVNGTMGRVTACDRFGVTVQTMDGEIIYFEMEDWIKLDSADNEVARFSQIPLKLAYAVTIHKSQGMTLDYCQIDFKRVFAPGQAYVALSRVRSLEGLSALNWNHKKVFCSREAYYFYERRKG